MKIVYTFFSTFGLIAVFSTTIARGQNLIVDGSFESPSEPTNGIYQGVTPVGWTGGFRLYRGNTGHPTIPGPEDGNQFEGILNNPISQTFSIVNAGLYRLTWFDNSSEQAAYANNVTIKNVSGTLFSTSDAGVAGVWIKRTAEIALGPGVDTLEFQGETLGGAHLIDNVSLVQIPDAANSARLLLIAFAGLVGMRRKFLRAARNDSENEPTIKVAQLCRPFRGCSEINCK